MSPDPVLLRGFAAIGGLLCFATAIALLLRGRIPSNTMKNLRARIRAWWVMTAVFAVALATGQVGTLLLFGLLSFFALREYITLAPTKRGDHRALFWTFFLVTPLQYILIGWGWYGLFSILIPVWVFLFLPARVAIAGDTEHFLERTSKVQWGLMICVYSLSHAPALLMLHAAPFNKNARLLFFLVVVVELGDVLQYVWGKSIGRHPIVPLVSPNKTWEGAIGGLLCAAGVGAAMWKLTPFLPVGAGLLALLTGIAGFAGGVTMSAIKRDSGVKDFGTVISGHGGVLDRVDSLCFAAPVFFHLVRYFYGA
ncbi:MAG TPA: phosphatidate cytidylyltransferase [Acidobacteriaceae bacterium]|jgi:phosphatidate cytidylyltransferase